MLSAMSMSFCVCSRAVDLPACGRWDPSYVFSVSSGGLLVRGHFG